MATAAMAATIMMPPPCLKKSQGALQFSSAHFDNARQSSRHSRRSTVSAVLQATASARDDLRDGGKEIRGRETRSALAIHRSSERLLGGRVAQRRKMVKRKGSPASRPRDRKEAGKEVSMAKDERDARKVENAQRLDKLPRKLWDKILDELESDDLFPLALSCRYFRQKQKELVARSRHENGKSRLALETNLQRKVKERTPASAEYLQFCRKEKAPKNVGRYISRYLSNPERIRCLAAIHGHLPLLQKLLKPLKMTDYGITTNAGKSSSQSLHLLLIWLLTCFSLSPLHSARRPTGDLAVAENPGGVQDECGYL